MPMQVHQARLLLQMEAPGADLTVGAPPALLDAAAAVWRQAARVVTVSEFHRDVSATLMAMGIPCASEALHATLHLSGCWLFSGNQRSLLKFIPKPAEQSSCEPQRRVSLILEPRSCCDPGVGPDATL